MLGNTYGWYRRQAFLLSECVADKHQREVATVRVEGEAVARDYLKDMVGSLPRAHDGGIKLLVNSMRKEARDYG